jgi:hypothetical protein
VFLQNSEVPVIFRIYGIIFLKKICRICPRHRGPGPPAPAHRSTYFNKRQSLVTGSAAQIKPIELVTRLLISVVHRRSDGWGGWLRPGAAPAHACSITTECGGSLEFMFPRATVVSFWWDLLLWDHSDEGNVFMLTLIGGELQRSPATVRRLGQCLSTVRAASGEVSAPRTCAKASQPKSQQIVWKVHVAHDREHDYHDNLHSTEVAQRYPQVGDFIASYPRPGDHHIVFHSISQPAKHPHWGFTAAEVTSYRSLLLCHG